MDSKRAFLRSCSLVFAPLALSLVLLYLFCGEEGSVAAFFAHCRAAYPDLNRAVSFLTRYGGIPFHALWGAILIAAVGKRDRRGIFLVGYYILFLLLALLIADILGIWVGRPRPGVSGGFTPFTLQRSHHSFPSNHVTEAVVTILPLAQYFRDKIFAVGCGVWLALLCFARIFLGRHHPSDIAGSVIIAAALVALLWHCVERSAKNPAVAVEPLPGPGAAAKFS